MLLFLEPFFSFLGECLWDDDVTPRKESMCVCMCVHMCVHVCGHGVRERKRQALEMREQRWTIKTGG